MHRVIVDAFAGGKLENQIADSSGTQQAGVKLAQFERYTLVMPRRPSMDELGDLIETFCTVYGREGKESFFLSARAEDVYGHVLQTRLSYSSRVHTVRTGGTEIPLADALRTLGYKVKTDRADCLADVSFNSDDV